MTDHSDCLNQLAEYMEEVKRLTARVKELEEQLYRVSAHNIDENGNERLGG